MYPKLLHLCVNLGGLAATSMQYLCSEGASDDLCLRPPLACSTWPLSTVASCTA